MEFSVIRGALQVKHVDNLTDWPDWLDEGYMNNAKYYKIRVTSAGSSFLSRLKLVFYIIIRQLPLFSSPIFSGIMIYAQVPDSKEIHSNVS